MDKNDLEITSQAYWEKYYNKSGTSQSQIVAVCGAYDEYWHQLFGSPEESAGKSLIEIGGHPGRYLAYLGNKYKVVPTSLDFNSDRTKIEESMRAMGVKDYHIIQANILDHKTDIKYDFVISNGFIEHFEDFNYILDKHMNYLKPGGKILVMIPNMKGFVYPYKLLVDKPNLDAHNTKCMNLKVFKAYAKRNGLEIEFLNYLGGFPFSVHQNLNFFQNLFFQFNRILFKRYLNKWIEKYPTKMFSSSIIAIYKN